MDKWLVILIFLVTGSNIYLVQSEKIETWGDLYNVRAIEEQTATAKWIALVVKTKTLRFPAVDIIRKKNTMSTHKKPRSFHKCWKFYRKASTIGK